MQCTARFMRELTVLTLICCAHATFPLSCGMYRTVPYHTMLRGQVSKVTLEGRTMYAPPHCAILILIVP
jgi:hypothetical protein